MNYKEFIRSGSGASDIMPLLAHQEAFHQLIIDLSQLVYDVNFDTIVAVDGRGLILGGAIGFHLNKGIVAVRQSGKLKNPTHSHTYTDYSNSEKTLEILQDSLDSSNRVVIIDDWVETGSTMFATIDLVNQCGAQIAAIVAFMDDTSPEIKRQLKVHNYRFLEQVKSSDNF